MYAVGSLAGSSIESSSQGQTGLAQASHSSQKASGDRQSETCDVARMSSCATGDHSKVFVSAFTGHSTIWRFARGDVAPRCASYAGCHLRRSPGRGTFVSSSLPSTSVPVHRHAGDANIHVSVWRHFAGQKARGNLADDEMGNDIRYTVALVFQQKHRNRTHALLRSSGRETAT